MGSEALLPAPTCKTGARDKEHPKPAITEARREQNRRAQRGFREYFGMQMPELDISDVSSGERRRFKKRKLADTTPRRLVPYPSEVGADVTLDTENLDHTKGVPSQETLTPSSSDQWSLRALQGQQALDSCTTEAPFTFFSAQTLFPVQECSLIPTRCTHYFEFLKLIRERPRYALWPHGATATLAACLFNARVLGIDIERVMDPHYMSPFYRPPLSVVLAEGPASASPSTDPVQVVASESRLTTFGPLRPCFAQICFPHHACLDLLPLPRLRELAVMLTVRAQQEGAGPRSSLLDSVQQLKKDVYVRQGLRFRGAGELRGDEKITSDESGRHCGHPWERTSWAVAPWFARKWRYLIDV